MIWSAYLLLFLLPHNVRDFSGDPTRGCVLYEDSYRCFGEFGYVYIDGNKIQESATIATGFRNAQEIAVGRTITCARDDDGIWCQGPFSQYFNFSNLRGARGLALAGPNTICAHNGLDLQCYEGRKNEVLAAKYYFPSITKIVGILSNSDSGVCVLSGSKAYRISTGPSRIETIFEDLKAPTEISCLSTSACVKDARGYQCNGYAPGFLPANYREFSDIKMSVNAICWKGPLGLECKGLGHSAGTTIENVPKSMKDADQFWLASAAYACARANVHFDCWGRQGEKKVKLPASSHPTYVSTSPWMTFYIQDGLVHSMGRHQILFESNAAGKEISFRWPWEGEKARAIAGTGFFVCRVIENAIECWHDYNVDLKEHTLPPVDWQATDLIMDSTVACAYGDSEIRCFGDSDYELSGSRFFTSGPIKTLHMSQYDNFVCALVGHSVECVSSSKPRWLSLIGNYQGRILKLAANEKEACFLTTEKEAKCTRDLQKSIPPLKSPNDIAMGGSFACAIDGGEVLCWGDKVPPVPAVSKATKLVVTSEHICVLDEVLGLQCSNNTDASRTPLDF